jgi:hypothetical protein
MYSGPRCMEAKLGFAQATNTLAELHHGLSVYAHLHSYKV